MWFEGVSTVAFEMVWGSWRISNILQPLLICRNLKLQNAVGLLSMFEMEWENLARWHIFEIIFDSRWSLNDIFHFLLILSLVRGSICRILGFRLPTEPYMIIFCHTALTQKLQSLSAVALPSTFQVIVKYREGAFKWLGSSVNQRYLALRWIQAALDAAIVKSITSAQYLLVSIDFQLFGRSRPDILGSVISCWFWTALEAPI